VTLPRYPSGILHTFIRNSHDTTLFAARAGARDLSGDGGGDDCVFRFA